MPVTKYKLHSLYINSVQIDPNDISSFQITLEQDPTNGKLPIGVCEIGIKNNSSYTFSEHNKIVVTFSCSVSGTSNIVYNFYISKIDRPNEEELSISAVDYIGLLDESCFEKAYKTATPALTIIADILTDINGTVLSRISSDVNLTPVFENMTKRQALQHVLFATGYRIRTNANQGNYDLEIYPESYESTAITIDDSVVYRGSSLVKNNEVNGVSVTSHDYKLDDFGTVVVGEERFKDKNKVRKLSRTSDIENIITVGGAVCIQETNLNDVALRIYNDYQRYQDLNFDYVWCGEHIGKKLTIEAEDGMHTGFLKKLFLDVGLLSVVASGSMVLPNNNIVSPTDTETQSVTSTGSISNEVTYSELVGLISNHKLVPGAKYVITDYVTKINGGQGFANYIEARSMEHPFKLQVEATSDNKLSQDAKALNIDNDSYFNNSLLNKWRIKYDINNDTTKYKWADATNGKGVIYELIDEYDNVAPYDFKNIQFKRYKITAINMSYESDPPIQDGVIGQYHGMLEPYYYSDGVTEDASARPHYVTINTSDYVWKYTFDNSGSDYSLSGKVSDVTIKPYMKYDDNAVGALVLNNITLTCNGSSFSSLITSLMFERNCHLISNGRSDSNVSYLKNSMTDSYFGSGANEIVINGGFKNVSIKNSYQIVISGHSDITYSGQMYELLSNVDFENSGDIYGQIYQESRFWNTTKISGTYDIRYAEFKNAGNFIVPRNETKLTIEEYSFVTITLDGDFWRSGKSIHIYNGVGENYSGWSATLTISFSNNTSHADVYRTGTYYR